MSIKLNTSSKKINGLNANKSSSNPKFGGKKQKHSNNSSDFVIEFTKTKNVKALVAKKRDPKVMAKKKEFQFITSNSNPIAEQKEVTSSSNSKLMANSTPIDTGDISLSLNTITGTDSDRRKTEKKQKQSKLNRKERDQLKVKKHLEDFKKNEHKLLEPITNKSKVKKQKPIDSQQSTATKSPTEKKPKKKLPSLFANNPVIPIVGQRLVKPVNEILFTGSSTSTINLHEHQVKNLSDILHITELTTVQQRTIPVALSGRDILIRSQTGSGKTLAYSLPIVQKLQEIRPKLQRTDGIQAIIIVPTRELAIQGYELFIKLLKPYTWIVSGYLTGGEKRKTEKARLRKGINILIATPGRLCDHFLNTESLKLNQVKWLILDEADRLFDFSYEQDVKKIVDALNEQTSSSSVGGSNENPFTKNPDKIPSNDKKENNLQTMLVSATLTPAVRKLAGLALKDPLYIDTSDVSELEKIKTNTFADEMMDCDEKIVIPSTVEQSYVLVPAKLRLITLTALIGSEQNKKSTKMLVFMATEQLVDYHHDLMMEILTNKVLDADDEEEAERRKGLLDSDDDDEDAEYDEEELNEKIDRITKRAAGGGDNTDNGPALLGDLRFFKLHGNLTQQERSAVVKAFKEAKSGVLLTTDVAARGIDVPEVDMIIQYSPPQNLPEYVHRVGRTGRAGRRGRTVLFLAPNETEYVRYLEDKRIRISQNNADKYMEFIVGKSLSGNNIMECASELQRKFEALLDDDKEMYDKACKAFVSWIRYSSSFTKELRVIFNIKTVHMGHYAKSLGIREPPKSFIKMHSEPKPKLPTNRLTYTDRNDQQKTNFKMAQKQQKDKTKKMSLNTFAAKSTILSTSEFGSGLPPTKKKKYN